jgi:general stress protein 26
MPADDIKRIADLLADFRFCMLTTTDADGHLVSRPMAVQQVEFDGDLWFFSDRDSRKVAQIATTPGVNASFSDNSSWVSLYGAAQVVQDPAKAEELWNESLKAWFPDGPDSPAVVLIKLQAHSAEFWDNPGGRVSTLISYAKAMVVGERAQPGDNEVVRL